VSRSTISTFQLFERFPDEESARIYLEGRIWPNGPVCPSCATQERVIALGACATRKPGYYRCQACAFDFTVRTGTVMERSKVPLHKWLYSMYLLVTARKGISSMQLAKEIGITQKSAWFVLGRLREACGGVFPEADRMSKPTPPELDKIADMVLAYRPKPKSKAARKRAKKAAKKGKG
jgi:transposase-like protein